MIPELLQRWATKQPTVCKETVNALFPTVYTIGEYEFWLISSGLVAQHLNYVVSGQPALDWLTGCVMRAIEAQELDYEHRYISQIGIAIPKHKVTIFNLKRGILRDDKIMALLTAYVEYLETQGK